MKKTKAIDLKKLFCSKGYKVSDNEVRIIRNALSAIDKLNNDVLFEREMSVWQKRASNLVHRVWQMRAAGRLPECQIIENKSVKDGPNMRFIFTEGDYIEVR